MRPPLQRHESASAANRKGRSWERGVKSETKASRGSDPARSCQLSPAAVWTAGRFATGPPTAGKSPAEFPTSERWRPRGGGRGKDARHPTQSVPEGTPRDGERTRSGQGLSLLGRIRANRA